MYWNAERVAMELDLIGDNGQPSARAAKSLMAKLKIPAVFLGCGRGRGYRWNPDDIHEALQKRIVGAAPAKKRIVRARKTVFDGNLSIDEQMQALRNKAPGLQ